MASISPEITHDLQISVTEGKDGTLLVQVVGEYSNFPGLEILVDDRLVYGDDADSGLQNAIGAFSLMLGSTPIEENRELANTCEGCLGSAGGGGYMHR